jgi:hypothetical protein
MKKKLKIENMAVDRLIKLLNDPETPEHVKEQILDMLDSYNDIDE